MAREQRCLRRSNATKTNTMIRNQKAGGYRLYSRKKNPSTSYLRTFKTRAAAEKHEREVQYFKQAG